MLFTEAYEIAPTF
jgi:superfamily I DNA and/or RNA helicase